MLGCCCFVAIPGFSLLSVSYRAVSLGDSTSRQQGKERNGKTRWKLEHEIAKLLLASETTRATTTNLTEPAAGVTLSFFFCSFIYKKKKKHPPFFSSLFFLSLPNSFSQHTDRIPVFPTTLRSPLFSPVPLRLSSCVCTHNLPTIRRETPAHPVGTIGERRRKKKGYSAIILHRCFGGDARQRRGWMGQGETEHLGRVWIVDKPRAIFRFFPPDVTGSGVPRERKKGRRSRIRRDSLAKNSPLTPSTPLTRNNREELCRAAKRTSTHSKKSLLARLIFFRSFSARNADSSTFSPFSRTIARASDRAIVPERHSKQSRSESKTVNPKFGSLNPVNCESKAAAAPAA